jgi:hypothetical protein
MDTLRLTAKLEQAGFSGIQAAALAEAINDEQLSIMRRLEMRTERRLRRIAVLLWLVLAANIAILLRLFWPLIPPLPWS